MWEKHEAFETPENNPTIWRFMDFTKFVSILETKSLFFSNPDKFDDKLEGAWPKANIERLKNIFEKKNLSIKPNLYINNGFRKCVFINCWHMNNCEAALWKLYLKSNEGIAVKSSFESLKNCFNSHEDDVFVGKVQYIVHESENDFIPEGNALFPFLHKHKCFEHERELRAVTIPVKQIEEKNKINPKSWLDRMDPGISVPINIECLINEIIIAPNSDPWYENLIKSIVARYGYDIPVSRSFFDKPTPYELLFPNST